MKFLTHIAIVLSVALAALLPNSMVLCEKDGRISIEFEQGNSCSCSEIIADLIEKFCCDEIQCHDDEQVTDDCHSELQISGSDCQDTKLNLPDFFKASDYSIKAHVKTLTTSHFFTDLSSITKLIPGMHKPVDVGKAFKTSPEYNSNTPLLSKRTTVLII